MLSLTETANLSVLYAQSHRHYHNIIHIQNCLSELEAYKKSELKLEHTPVGLDCIEKAIWYHDAIYNPYSSMQTMLQRFKATGVLYYTPHFKERYEAQAIKNMEDAIRRNETRPHFGYLPRTFP